MLRFAPPIMKVGAGLGRPGCVPSAVNNRRANSRTLRAVRAASTARTISRLRRSKEPALASRRSSPIRVRRCQAQSSSPR